MGAIFKNSMTLPITRSKEDTTMSNISSKIKRPSFFYYGLQCHYNRRADGILWGPKSDKNFNYIQAFYGK